MNASNDSRRENANGDPISSNPHDLEAQSVTLVTPSDEHSILSHQGDNIFWEHYIKEYHPIWNIAFMSTGICAGILYKFPYPARWLEILGLIMWGISLLLFILVTSFTALKLYKFPVFRKDLIQDPAFSVFLGPYSMGWSTLTNMIHYLADGEFVVGQFVFWWINVVLAIFCGWFLVFILFSKSKITPPQLNFSLILPVLPLTVCAACGALVARDMDDHRSLQMTTSIVSFLLWANSLCLGFGFIYVFFGRLLLLKLPPKAATFAMFAPIGLMGQGAWGIANQSYNMSNFFGETENLLNHDLVRIVIHWECFFWALMLLAFGFFILAISSATCIFYYPIPFSRAWWTMTFPIGTLSVGCTQVYHSFGLPAFRVMGAMFGTVCILLVLVCLVGSVIVEFPHGPVKLKARASQNLKL
ncbi:BA75_02162T0 [Komagataella pastoris]|uniref:BA75_02162T0 n=1 Tax=Komagataella pastoris TaxID=4922 RepID=A0A1B2JCC3_PICPA|nr:BA75_02162T0 [Komagataella pastoris]